MRLADRLRADITPADFGGDLAAFRAWEAGKAYLAELLMGAWPNNPDFPLGYEERDAKGV